EWRIVDENECGTVHAPMFCPRCGQSNEAMARFCQSCGNDLTVAKPAAPTVEYAGFWTRVVAILIDTIVIVIVEALLAGGTMGHLWFAGPILPWLYEALMLSSEKQATVGKMALGIVVTDLAGNRISFARATGRHFAKWISA